MKVRIGAGDLDGLVPVERVRAGARIPVEFHEHAVAALIDHAEGVHAEALHHAIAARNGAIRHHPHLHVHGLGHQRHEIPERVVRARRLRHGVVRLGLHGMDEIGKFHRVLDEEHRHVVADEIPVALVGVELDREAAHVARRVGRTAFTRHRREPHEHRGALAGLGEQRRARDLRERLITFEVAMSARAAGVDDALGNPLVVEVGDLLAQDEIFEQRRPAQSRFQGILVVGDVHALVRREGTRAAIRAHPVERPDRGVESGRRAARAGLGRRIGLRERAAGNGHVFGLERLARRTACERARRTRPP